MAGRKLRHQREAALKSLSDADATELARSIAPQFRMTTVRNLLLSTRAEAQRLLAVTGGDYRAALAVVLREDPSTARLAIAMTWHEPHVEEALGIRRTPNQQNH